MLLVVVGCCCLLIVDFRCWCHYSYESVSMGCYFCCSLVLLFVVVHACWCSLLLVVVV